MAIEKKLFNDVHRVCSVSAPLKPQPAPVCECGAHLACSRSRLAMINDPSRNEKYVTYLKQHIRPDSVCLSLGDSSLLPIIAARLGAKHIYAIETNSLGAVLTKKFAHHNGVADRVTVLQKHPEEITKEMLNNEKVGDWFKYCRYNCLASLSINFTFLWQGRSNPYETVL